MFFFWFYRTTLLADIRRILYPPSICNRTVYDFDAIVNRSTITTLNNDDEQRFDHFLSSFSIKINFSRCQMRSNTDHLLFDSQFECGNLRKAIQVKNQFQLFIYYSFFHITG